MQPWATERGTLWALETGNGLPPVFQAQVEASFEEADQSDVEALAKVMNRPTAKPIRRRLRAGRRCFTLKVGDQIITYGWLTHGVEHVGELERQFNLRDDEAYIWDCSTAPAWRGRGCYSALLNHMIYRLHQEDVPRIWIGASRQNKPSIRGFANAGFRPVVDLTYRRLFSLTLMWIREASPNGHPLVPAAYRVLLNDHERRIGQLAVGYRR